MFACAEETSWIRAAIGSNCAKLRTSRILVMCGMEQAAATGVPHAEKRGCRGEGWRSQGTRIKLFKERTCSLLTPSALAQTLPAKGEREKGEM